MIANLSFPNSFLGGLWYEERDPLALVTHQPFDEHQANESLTGTNAVAKERTAPSLRRGKNRSVTAPLVPSQLRKRRRGCSVPFVRFETTSFEQTV